MISIKIWCQKHPDYAGLNHTDCEQCEQIFNVVAEWRELAKEAAQEGFKLEITGAQAIE